MKTTPTTKQIILQKKFEANELLKEAIEHHEHCETASSAIRQTQRVALWHAWQVGIRLNKMKTLIGRGDWLDWLDLHFCKPLKISIRTAQVYMKIDWDNANLRDKAKTQRVAPTGADFQLLTKLKFDTIRKYAFSFIPKKHDTTKGRDMRISRLHSFLNIVNRYCALRYRHVCGLHTVDFEEVREETGELYQFLQWIHGDSPQNPWDSYAYPRWRKNALRKREERVLKIAAKRFRETDALGGRTS